MGFLSTYQKWLLHLFYTDVKSSKLKESGCFHSGTQVKEWKTGEKVKINLFKMVLPQISMNLRLKEIRSSIAP